MRLRTGRGESSRWGGSAYTEPPGATGTESGQRQSSARGSCPKSCLCNGCWVGASFPASTRTNVTGEDVPDMQLEKRLSKEWNRQPKRGSSLRRRGRWLAHLRGKPAGPHTTPESAFSCREEAAIKRNVSESRVIIDIFLFINMIGWLNISRHLFCFVLFKKNKQLWQ